MGQQRTTHPLARVVSKLRAVMYVKVQPMRFARPVVRLLGKRAMRGQTNLAANQSLYMLMGNALVTVQDLQSLMEVAQAERLNCQGNSKIHSPTRQLSLAVKFDSFQCKKNTEKGSTFEIYASQGNQKNKRNEQPNE
jgi:hypothetical protein